MVLPFVPVWGRLAIHEFEMTVVVGLVACNFPVRCGYLLRRFPIKD